MDKTNINSLDLAKFVMAIMIIVLHFDPINQGGVYSVLRFPILYLPVPLFFVISSYLFFRKDEESRSPRKFVIRNMKLYLVYFLLFLPYYLKSYISMFEEGLWDGILTFLTKFLFDSTFRNSWFIISLVFGVVIVHYLSKINKMLPIAVGVLTYFMCMAETSFSNTIQSTKIQEIMDCYPGYLIYSFPLATTWCSLGYYVSFNSKKISSVVGGGGGIIDNFYIFALC